MSVASRRLIAISVAASFFWFARSLQMFASPFWVTQDLQLEPGDWAFLSSLRWMGAFFAIIPLGILAERIGVKKWAICALILSGISMMTISQSGFIVACLLITLMGPLVSSSFVTANTLVQLTGEEIRTSANSVYRSISTAAGILSPIAAAIIFGVTGNWASILAIGGVFMIAAACSLLGYPDVVSSQSNKLTNVWAKFRDTLKNRDLKRYLIIDQVSALGLVPAGVFAALRFTQEIGLSEQDWSYATAVGGVLTLVFVMISAKIIKTIGLAKATAVAWIASAVGSITIGVTDIAAIALPIYIASVFIAGIASVSFSLWLNRIGGVHSFTFTLHKVASAGTVAIGLAIFGALEKLLGMRLLLIAGPALTIIASVLIFRLQRGLADNEPT